MGYETNLGGHPTWDVESSVLPRPRTAREVGSRALAPDVEAETESFLLDLDEEVLEWQAKALCAQSDPEAFFPEKGGSTREAKKICQGCEVRIQCLEYALANGERFGIWGGLSERERRKLFRRAW